MSHRISTDVSSPSTEHHTNFDNIAKILLIGETGSGKSTFINYLYNYFHRGDLNNLKIAIPCKYHPFSTEQLSHHELNIHDNTQSKTNTCTQYRFTDSITHKQYLFLDTPGLSDTHDIEQNEININKIIDAVTQLGNLTTVIIVVNGSISRLTIHLRSVIACINSNIPDIILENVIVLLTNVKKHESTFDLKMLNLHGKVYPFYMQNDAFVSDPQTWKKFIHDELQHDWDYSMNQIKLILQTIDSFKQISINAFIQMKQIRNEIKLIIHQIRLEMIQIQKIQNELSILDIAFKQADQDVIIYHDHTRLHIIEKTKIIDAPYHSTLCTNCNEVCHNNCHLNETKIMGAQIFSQCQVMNYGKCQQCRNHCSYINHYHAKKTIQTTYETLHDILIDLKDKYDQAYENRNNYQEKILTISEIKLLLERTLKLKMNEFKIKTKELLEICSSFNIAQELKYLIEQFKIESNLLENLETKLQNEQLIKTLTKLSHLIEENQEENRRKRPPMQIIYIDESLDHKPTDINHLKTIDLIELHNKTIDHSLIRLILEELHRRAQGKTTDPLSTSNEIMIINKYLEKYNHKTVHDLSYLYHKLQTKINSIIDSNILKIIDVNPELLIENFIVQTLLDEKEKDEDNHQDTSFFETTPQPHSQTRNNSFSQPVYSPPYPTNEPILPPSKSSRINSPLIGFTHVYSAPYPSPDQPSPMPAPPSDYPPINQQNKHQSQPFFRFEDYRYDSSNRRSPTSLIDHQDFMPMPMDNEKRLTNLYNSNIGFSFNNPIEHQRMTPSNEHSSQPDVIPFNSDLFRSLDNSHLLLLYANANLQKNESQKHAIYQELERRCYGEYPMLIKQKKNFFEERIKINEMKTYEELLIAQTAIKQKIRGYLKNDDVTLINDIPLELIIEANVLNQLILSKRRI
jgi:GTPase SAR1 family protein